MKVNINPCPRDLVGALFLLLPPIGTAAPSPPSSASRPRTGGAHRRADRGLSRPLSQQLPTLIVRPQTPLHPDEEGQGKSVEVGVVARQDTEGPLRLGQCAAMGHISATEAGYLELG